MNSLFKPKFFTLLTAGIKKEQIITDILSGIVVGIVALPLAIAFAVASGTSPEKGIITAIVAGFIISFLGGSRVQIGGPTGAFVIIVFDIVQRYGTEGLFISTILAGIFLIIFGLLKLGYLLKFFPRPLIVGFTSGIALVIFSTQIKDAFGLSLNAVPSDFIAKWILYLKNLSTLNPYALGLTITTIFITVFAKKIFKRVPGSFIAIILGTIIVQITEIPVATIQTYFGEINNTITFSLPQNFNLKVLPYYIQPALTIALLGAIESLLSAVVADGMISGNHRSNTELIAQGIANLTVPFFGGIPATGAIARTATNIKNGGRTPIAGMIHSIVLLLIMLFLGNFAKLIPMPVLAGILIVIAFNMSEWRSFLSTLRGSKFDALILLTTFFLTVLVDLTLAIEVGVVLAALLLMMRMAQLSSLSTEIDQDIIADYGDIPQGIGIYEISGPLFFGSAKQYSQTIKEIGVINKCLIIRMRHVPFIDSTGLHNLADTLKILDKSRTKVILSGINPSVLKDLNSNGIFNIIGEKAHFPNFNDALSYAKTLVS